MKKKNKKNRYKYLTIIILIIIVIVLLILKRQKIPKTQDDILFFKLLGNQSTINNLENTNKFSINGNNIIGENFDSETTNNKNKTKENRYSESQIVFNVQKGKQQEKDMDFLSIVNNDIHIEEKVAPGEQGYFYIKIKSNENVNYQLYFQSESEKPKNLVFNSEDNINSEYGSLEDISDNLKGNLKANEEKIIRINWKWEYEQDEEQNIQDTEDGKKIKQYKFKIILNT